MDKIIRHEYRLFIHKGKVWIDEDSDYFDIREIYYDELGYISSISEDPVYIGGNTTDDINYILHTSFAALSKPPLDYELSVANLENDNLIKDKDMEEC